MFELLCKRPSPDFLQYVSLFDVEQGILEKTALSIEQTRPPCNVVSRR